MGSLRADQHNEQHPPEEHHGPRGQVGVGSEFTQVPIDEYPTVAYLMPRLTSKCAQQWETDRLAFLG